MRGMNDPFNGTTDFVERRLGESYRIVREVHEKLDELTALAGVIDGDVMNDVLAAKADVEAIAASVTGSATAAATSATTASDSADVAVLQAAAAVSARDAAETAMAGAQASYDQFDDRYLGSKTADPTLDNDGNALLEGALYWNSVAQEMRVRGASSWNAAYVPAGDYVQTVNFTFANLGSKPTTMAGYGITDGVSSSLIGAVDGIAPLDATGKIAATYLPSYVDDVLEYANLAAFPGTGETGKIYVAIDTNKTYRWSGSAYTEISASPGSTDSVTEGAINKYYTDARVIAAPATGLADTVGTPSAADTILTILGKIKKALFTDLATSYKAKNPSIQSVASSATVTPTFSDDQVNITAQAAALNLANPTGTAVDAWGIVIRIKDNGTARAITYDTQYRAIGVTLPTTTVLGKTLYLGMVFNNVDTKWDVVAVAQEA